jgi:hypothetical protein
MYWGRPVKIDTALYPISTQRNLAVAPDDISMPLNPNFYGSCLAAWRQCGGSGGSLAATAVAEALRCQLGAGVAEAAAAWLQRQRNDGGDGGGATA